MRKVIVETPYAGDIESNVAYLKECLRDCLERGEAPYASHLFFTQFLDDDDPAERTLGITAGLTWGYAADRTVVYHDRGVSAGMRQGIEDALRNGRAVEYRRLYNDRAGFCIRKQHGGAAW